MADLKSSFLIKSVSTIPDECRGVGCEIGTHPKRKAIANAIDDIVSTSGDRGIIRAGLQTVMTLTVSVNLRTDAETSAP